MCPRCLQRSSVGGDPRSADTRPAGGAGPLSKFKLNPPAVIMQEYTKAVREFVEEHPRSVTAVLVTGRQKLSHSL